MTSGPDILFPPFRLDVANERLWRDSQLIPLRPKIFAVLRYLAEHAGRLVTKEELRRAVWPDIHVSEAGQRDYIRTLRKALGDDPEAPRFIETVHGRGYRFIAQVIRSQDPSISSPKEVRDLGCETRLSFPEASRLKSQAPHLVGRDAELGQLHGWFNKASCGERQIVFVTGEPGIGKTTLVEAFLAGVAGENRVWIARGQCIEQYGIGEAYLPVLDAFGHLCRGPAGARVVPLLRRYAPTWLSHMPWLLEEADREEGRHKTGASQERMLRELVEALEVLTDVEAAHEPPLLVVWLEDLHWSDYATLDLLGFLAQRRNPARLMLIGTYRPVEVLTSGHPLRSVSQELQIHGYSKELRLGPLTESDVAAFLVARFPHSSFPRELTPLIYQRTEGNPLFLVNVVEYLVTHGVIAHVEGQWVVQATFADIKENVPEGLRLLVEKQLARLSLEEQRVLEAASVAGREFSAAAVAAGVEADVGQVEEWCEGFVRREQLLQARGQEQWPDGTIAARYRFLHALYQNVLYERVPAGRRVRLHQRIGEREEAGYGARAPEHAAELALHFEQGQDSQRAVHYLQHAAQNAARRGGYQEVLAHASKGLELLKTLSDTPECRKQELMFQADLGLALQSTKGTAFFEAEQAFARALELCHQVEEPLRLLSVLQGRQIFYMARGELQMARDLGEQCLSLAQRGQDPARLAWAHVMLGQTFIALGAFVSAREHLEQGIGLADHQQFPSIRIAALSLLSTALSWLGYWDQATGRREEALILARAQSNPYSLAWALYAATMCAITRQEWHAAQKWAEAVTALSTEHGFQFWLAQGMIMRGVALAEQGQLEEGIARLRQGLDAYQATGIVTGLPYFLTLLARAYGKARQCEEGLTIVDEALAGARKIGQPLPEAWALLRRGELLLQSEVRTRPRQVKADQGKSETPNPRPLTLSPQAEAEAEACFCKAIEIARRQSVKVLELGAAMSLSRLWQQQGKKAEARQLLAEVYGWFTEGFDTADLKEARALLEELM